MTHTKKAKRKTGRKKPSAEKEADPVERLLKLIRSLRDKGDKEDAADAEADRLAEKIRAAIQSGELRGRSNKGGGRARRS
jgi:hypothetical protein